ncbi:anthranilate phosphoribosyltransferase [Boudabousia liubingyangii]|uniref:Anthranilate phosphoribosyltransferase n=1 Tax=Boudabousia liubingyangii TaxID=1921764 RepID=A0A1Q5PK34_9ACTO|nr:anthranilate phosphoribosyltransferase [Boudabousia liubingyangii]OKL46585.1 anthranilate phosphoribosyltransferase [Boudabousia liubingyangii]OKL46829.1 anthranilate phosphoribosyltransferase [Boudabousia liubingyangii]
MSTDVTALIRQVINGQELSQEQAQELFAALSNGELSEIQTAALLAGLHSRGESAEELAGAAAAFRAVATEFPTQQRGLVDVVGTGGDGALTINISTAAGLVAASLGVPVAKHGNRSVSSKSGAADVLEALGLNLNATPQEASQSLAEKGFTFLFAQAYHPAMRFVAPVRKALAAPTIFNLVGPLINPAPLDYQVMGVANPDYLDLVAAAMVRLGRQRALVVHGDGLDELAVHGPTHVREATPDGVKSYRVTPEELGIQTWTVADLRGGDGAENAELLKEVLGGKGQPAHRDAIAVNAGAVLFTVGKAETLAEGTQMALEQLATGKPLSYLEDLVSGPQGAK